MKYIISYFFFFFSIIIFSQDKYSKEISFVNDNDLYVSINRDRYYTNGMFLSYRYLSNTKNKKIEKRILEWQIGHEMFTPFRANVKSINEHDRPFAGHLFGSFGVAKVYKNNSIFNTKVQLGIIGPGAFGEELQEYIHALYGFKEAVGWKHQIKNALSLNFETKYVKYISVNKTNDFDISWVSKARAGTVYTDLSTGFYSRIGTIPLSKILNSIAFNTHLNDNSTSFKREVESFFYIKPMLRYALYDATIQGSFLNTNSEVTRELIPFVFNIEVGFRFTAKRFNFRYVFNYNTSKSKDLRYTYGNKFGTIAIHYLLH